MAYPRYPVNAGNDAGYSCCPANFTPETCPAGGRCGSGCPYDTVDRLKDGRDRLDPTEIEIYPDAQNQHRR